jgi:hypothetical protein
MSGNRSSRLRILVLRDPGFQLDGQDTGSGEITAMLEQEPSFKVSESAARAQPATVRPLALPTAATSTW